MTDKPKRNPFGLPQARDPEWFRIENAATTNDEPSSANVYVYDAIDSWFGVNAAEFTQQVDALDVDQINLYVNSPGGSIFDAQAMVSALQRNTATVTAYVDGLAASAASFLLTAADEVVMSPNAEIFLHDGIGMTYGNVSDHQETIDVLDRLSNVIAGMYAKKAGGTAADWRAVMQNEQWYNADEAVEAGLADRVLDSGEDKSTQDVENRFDLSMYRHPGRSHAPKPRRAADVRASLVAQTIAANAVTSNVHTNAISAADLSGLSATLRGPKLPAEPEEPTNTHKEVEQMPDIKKVTDRLGLSAEATEDEIVNAINGLEQRHAALPDGVVPVDKAQFDNLVADARAGREAREQQVTDRRARLVENAIHDGKIPAGRRDHYAALLAADEEGTTELLKNLEANVIPVETIGNGGGVDEATDEDVLYNRFFPKTADEKKEA